MSHEIGQHDVTVFGMNKPAWHGLGTVFAGLMSPMRAFAEGVGMRDVISLPCVIDGQEFPESKALFGITHTGSRVPLSVVGADYGVLKDQRVFELLERVYHGRAVVETAGTLRDGKRLWVLVRRDGFTVGQDVIVSYDLWVNRHDGSGCFELHRTHVRVVCANTWRMAIGSGRNRVFGVRHTVNVEQGATIACNLLQMLAKAEVEEQRKTISLAKRDMGRSEAGAFFAQLVGLDLSKPLDDQSAKARTNADTLAGLFLRGTGNLGKTRWDAFNAVTEFVDHAKSVRVVGGRNRQEVKFESALMGTGDDLKVRAFDLLVNA